MNRITSVKKLIQKTVQSGSMIIGEDDSKIILSLYGIPVVPEKQVLNPDEAVQASEAFGFPVVIKAIARGISHKSEHGHVKLGLTGPDQVREAAVSFLKKGTMTIDSLLVQPMLKGSRQWVAGMFRDPLFGPVIMFGLGGIYTEVLNDVVFKLAPLTSTDLDDLVSELSSRELLYDFRGERGVDKEIIKNILNGLGEIALTFPEIQEIDINPLILSPEGTLTAVDAVIVAGTRKSEICKRPDVDKAVLGELFYPDSVAFVGASGSLGKWGHMLLTNTLSGNYPGRIYLVNPKGGMIAGQTVNRSLSEIDGTIDLAVVTIPASQVMDLIPQLKEKKTKGMLLITSGFSETGKDGARLEKDLVQAASEAGIVVLGPNTMGICNPHKKFFFSGAHVHPLAGSTALVCQSGNMGTQLLAFAQQQDIGIRAFSGSGNEAMVTIEDYMEAFEIDELTRTVVMYIESVKDGRRFFESASRVSRKKPVVVLRGGRTEAGGKAAASHTGALASDSAVFNAACRQAGIIQVKQSIELLDLSAVFSSLPLPKGSRVAIMTLGGGWGVVTCDLCLEHGLEVPELPESIVKKLDQLLPSYWSRGNPVDIVGEADPQIPMVAVEELLKWDGCDAVIHLGIHGKRIFVEKMVDTLCVIDPEHSKETLESIKSFIFEQEEAYIRHVIDLTHQYEKPVLGVSLLTDQRTRTIYRKEGGQYNGVFFSSPERAVKALSGMCQYQTWLKKHV